MIQKLVKLKICKNELLAKTQNKYIILCTFGTQKEKFPAVTRSTLLPPSRDFAIANNKYMLRDGTVT